MAFLQPLCQRVPGTEDEAALCGFLQLSRLSGAQEFCTCRDDSLSKTVVLSFCCICRISALLGQLEDKRTAGTEGSKQFFHLTSQETLGYEQERDFYCRFVKRELVQQSLSSVAHHTKAVSKLEDTLSADS